MTARVALVRVLDVDEHRAPVRCHVDAGDLAADGTDQKTPQAGVDVAGIKTAVLNLAGNCRQHLVVVAVRLAAVSLDPQQAGGVEPQAVAVRERVVRGQGGEIGCAPGVGTKSEDVPTRIASPRGRCRLHGTG